MKHLFVILAAVLFAAAPLKAQVETILSPTLIAPSTTYSATFEYDNCDSADVLVEVADSAQGRVKLTAMVYLSGVLTATVDTVALGYYEKLVPGQFRIPWHQIVALAGGTWTAPPAYIRVQFITNSTKTVSGAATGNTAKMVAIKVRKHRR